MAIHVDCSCGKKLLAPDGLEGTRIKCRDCGAVHLVPTKKAASSAFVAELDELPAPKASTAPPPRKPAAPIAKAPAVSPVAPGAPKAMPPAKPATPIKAVKKPAKDEEDDEPTSSNLTLVLGLAGGGVAALLLLIGGLFFMGVFSGPAPGPVAEAPPPVPQSKPTLVQPPPVVPKKDEPKVVTKVPDPLPMPKEKPSTAEPSQAIASLPADSVGFLTFRIADWTKTPSAQKFLESPFGKVAVEGLQKLGVKFEDMAVLRAALVPNLFNSPMFIPGGSVLEMNRDMDWDKVIPQLKMFESSPGDLTISKREFRKRTHYFIKPRHELAPLIVVVHDTRTIEWIGVQQSQAYLNDKLKVGHPTLEKLLAERGNHHLFGVGLITEEHASKIAKNVSPPPGFESAREIRQITFSVQDLNPLKLDLKATFSDAKQANEAKKAIEGLIPIGQAIFSKLASDPKAAPPSQLPIFVALDEGLKNLKLSDDGANLLASTSMSIEIGQLLPVLIQKIVDEESANQPKKKIVAVAPKTKTEPTPKTETEPTPKPKETFEFPPAKNMTHAELVKACEGTKVIIFPGSPHVFIAMAPGFTAKDIAFAGHVLAAQKDLFFTISLERQDGVDASELEPLTGIARLKTLKVPLLKASNPKSLEVLAKFKNLERLEIAVPHPSAFMAMAELKKLNHLTANGTFDRAVTDEGFEALKGLPELETIVLGSFKGKSLEALADCPKLTRLEFVGGNLDEDNFKSLLPLRKLKSVSLLSMGEITDAGVQQLGLHPTLKILSISFTDKITGTCLEKFTKLESLDLVHTKIDDDHLKGLGKLNKLKSLSLPTGATPKVLPTLEKMTHLNRLSVSATFTKADVDRLQKKLKNTKVVK